MNSSVLGIIFLGVDDKTLREMFQPMVDQRSDNFQGGNNLVFAIRIN